MSSFIVENKTLNRIVNFCFWVNDDLLKHEIQRELKEIGIILHGFNNDEETDQALLNFGKELLKMNIGAYYFRYKGNESISEEIKEDIKQAIEDYKYEETPLKDRQIEQVLKSIHCYLYQCSEGDIDQLPLYKTLRNIDHLLSSHIINSLPTYESAVWA